MNKDKQIKRIKQLISEDTLYGNHIDKVILNEGGGAKPLIDDILTLFKTTPSLKSVELPKIKKGFISNIDTSTKGIANRTDVVKLKNYLDANSTTGNIYDDLVTEIKSKLEPLKNIETTIIDNQGNLMKSSIYNQISKSIEDGISKAKESNIYKDFGADDISTSFDDLIPGISNSYKIGKKSNFLFNYNWKNLTAKIQTLFVNYFKRLIDYKQNINNFKSVRSGNFDAKNRNWAQKWFRSQYELFGGRTTFLTILGISIAKFSVMANICDDTTGVINVKYTNSDSDTSIGEDDVNEQEEKTASGQVKDWFPEPGAFFLGLLDIFILDEVFNPFGVLSDILKNFGIEYAAFADLTEWDCDDIRTFKQNMENIEISKENKALIDKGVEEATEHFKKSVPEFQEILKVEVTDTVREAAEANGVKNLTQEDMMNFFNTMSDSTKTNSDSTKNN